MIRPWVYVFAMQLYLLFEDKKMDDVERTLSNEGKIYWPITFPPKHGYSCRKSKLVIQS